MIFLIGYFQMGSFLINEGKREKEGREGPRTTPLLHQWEVKETELQRSSLAVPKLCA